MPDLVGFDFETFPIGPEAIAPKPVCLALYHVGEGSFLIGNDDLDKMGAFLEDMLSWDDVILIAQKASFDTSIVATWWPHLLPKLYAAYLDRESIRCTVVREKLLNLSTHGKLEKLLLPDQSYQRMGYHLDELVKNYCGDDISANKDDEDSWRTNYSMLDGVPADEYPEEAARYALDDAKWAVRVFEAQNERLEDEGASLETEELHTAVDFCLRMMTCHGIAIDEALRDQKAQEVAELVSADKMDLLIARGVLRPAEAPRPYKNNPNKMTKGKPESIDKKKLQALIKEICDEHELEIKKTPTGKISADEEVLQDLEGLSPTLDQYHERQRVQKIITTELPRIQAPVVHPCFDVLKETGRTSSYADKLFPSCNIQNVDPRIRGCYIPRPGHVLISCDYSAIELVSLAQKCYSLFGASRLRDLINDGIDPHAFLGSQLAAHLDQDFKELCEERELDGAHEIFQVFWRLKSSEDDAGRTFFKKYRTFAKPTGLGYPGMLGPDTFVGYAKTTYGVQVSVEEATALREIWFQTFPEMRQYFDWIQTHCPDGRNHGDYCYLSPLGMVRVGCSICAAANGAALQTPTGEGSKLAIVLLSRACLDPSEDSILQGCNPVAWIHDEALVEVPDDELMTDRADEIARLMVDGMSLIMTDVAVKAEPAAMRRWDKRAEPVRSSEGKLEVWVP